MHALGSPDPLEDRDGTMEPPLEDQPYTCQDCGEELVPPYRRVDGTVIERCERCQRQRGGTAA